MEFEHAAIALLSSVILVLSGMVGWIYWQQTRLFQNMNTLATAVGEIATRLPAIPDAPAEGDPIAEAEIPVQRRPSFVEPPEDDRVSVEEEAPPTTPAVVDGPPATDNDDLESKTATQLRDILTKRGIPFGKRDPKTILISLLKATS
jgi:hypothetical protein